MFGVHGAIAAMLAIIATLAGGGSHLADEPSLTARLTALSTHGQRPVRVRLHLTMSPGWHIAAEQPGTAGLATRVTWFPPPGWRLAAVRWPRPTREIDGRDTLFTYAGALALDAEFQAPATDGRIPLRVVVAYGLCREICVPGRVAVELTP